MLRIGVNSGVQTCGCIMAYDCYWCSVGCSTQTSDARRGCRSPGFVCTDILHIVKVYVSSPILLCVIYRISGTYKKDLCRSVTSDQSPGEKSRKPAYPILKIRKSGRIIF